MSANVILSLRVLAVSHKTMGSRRTHLLPLMTLLPKCNTAHLQSDTSLEVRLCSGACVAVSTYISALSSYPGSAISQINILTK